MRIAPAKKSGMKQEPILKHQQRQKEKGYRNLRYADLRSQTATSRGKRKRWWLQIVTTLKYRMEKSLPKLPDVYIVNKILLLKGQRVMLDSDLAELYDVPTKRINEAVRRNVERFPEDFMFQLTKEEYDSLRSQIATLKRGQHSKYLPNVFTEHGVLMLANVLKSERAIEMSVQIIRVFVQMRELALTHKDILVKVLKIEKKITEHDEELEMLFEAVKGLLNEPKKDREKIGYKITGKKNAMARKGLTSKV